MRYWRFHINKYFCEINIVVHRNQHLVVRTKQGLTFDLDYVLGDPREEKQSCTQSCTQNVIPFNCYPHFSLLGAVWAAPKHWCDFLIHEVKLLDCGFMNFLYILRQSPCNWRIMMHWNVVLTIFRTQQFLTMHGQLSE